MRICLLAVVCCFLLLSCKDLQGNQQSIQIKKPKTEQEIIQQIYGYWKCETENANFHGYDTVKITEDRISKGTNEKVQYVVNNGRIEIKTFAFGIERVVSYIEFIDTNKIYIKNFEFFCAKGIYLRSNAEEAEKLKKEFYSRSPELAPL